MQPIPVMQQRCSTLSILLAKIALILSEKPANTGEQIPGYSSNFKELVMKTSTEYLFFSELLITVIRLI